MKRFSTETLLFLFFFSIYAFTMSGRIQFGDETEKYRVAQSIVERGDFSFRPTVMRSHVGADGRVYSIYELGQTALVVPLYALGRVVDSFFPQPDANGIGILFVGFLNPLITALTCVVLFWTALAFGFRYRTALTLTVVFGLATVAWAYSKGFTREPLLGLCILLTGLAARRYAQTRAPRFLRAAGVAAGYLVFSKFIQAMVLPFIALYMLATSVAAQKRADATPRAILRASVRALALFALPGMVLVGLQSGYGYLRFGTFYGGIAGSTDPIGNVIRVEVNQSNFVGATLGLLTSAEKSVWLYALPALLFFPAWWVWLKRARNEAWLVAGVILITFISTAMRGDWGGGSNWGPRYLEQITALLIIPIGALLESPKPLIRRLASAALALLFGAGVFVQSIGVFTNDREILDITGARTHLTVALDYLRHGALDSLVLALSPTGFQINPYGALLAALAALCAIALVARGRAGAEPGRGSPHANIALVVVALSVQLGAFVAFVAAPLPQVVAARGNTRFVAGSQFERDGRMCEARALYGLAVEQSSDYAREIVKRLDDLMPRAPGDPFTPEDLMAEVDKPANAQIARDDANSISGTGALRMQAPLGRDAIASATSVWAEVAPNAAYEISGWIRTENVYGGGYAVMTLYEDDGAWGKSRAFDVTSLDETNGWRQFRRPFKTWPTTKRLLLITNLWKTFGTMWVDGVQIASESSASRVAAAPCSTQ